MKRLLFRLLFGLAALAVIIAALITLTLRASLPQIDGEIAVTGLCGRGKHRA